jgi:hypothetical protein
METIFGDGSEQQSGLFGKLKREKSPGESLFMTAFINQQVCFSLSWKILPIDLNFKANSSVKSSFYAAKGVSVELNFLKTRSWSLVVKVSSCKKLKATDCLYTQAELKRAKSGEVLKVDTAASVLQKMWIMISSSSAESSILFGGDYATLAVRNRLYTIITFSRLADRIIASAPRAGGEAAEVFRRFRKLDGDNRF